MSESEPQPPTPSPSLPLPPGPDPSEGAMALEPVRLLFLADAPSSRPPSRLAPIADSAAGGESEDSGDGSSIISEVSGSGDNGGDGGLEDGASARNKSRTGSRAIAPSDGSGPGGNGRDGDGVGGCGTDSDMVADGWHSEG
ncbi:hypothetical protein E4U22_006461 [Claviceps purpurea]|nr:hypothetical protein E4U22_006461 [Claviceps purpurea]